MSNNKFDELIKNNLDRSQSFSKDIDVRQKTMARIEALEIKREKIRYFSVWLLSLFSAATCLYALAFFENVFSRLRAFFFFYQLNPLTLKLIFQGFFATVLLGLFFLMIYMVSTRDQLFFIPES
jgi:hypothetical protein